MKKITFGLSPLLLSLFLLISGALGSQVFVNWNATNAATNTVSGTAIVNGITVNVTATATDGDNNNIFEVGVVPKENNLNGATERQILRSSAGEVGAPNKITFTFDRPVVVSEYSVTDVDSYSARSSVNRVAWYEAFTLSGANFANVASGNMQSNATVSTSGVRFSTPLLSTPILQDGVEWVRFTSSSTLSSFTHSFEGISLLYNLANRTFSSAINYYALKISLPCSPTNFLQNVTTAAATCPGNGSVNINYSQANIGSEFNYQILQGTSVIREADITPTATTFSRTEQNLPAGNYTLRTRELRCDGVTREQTSSFTIANNFVRVAFNAVVECSVNVRVNVTQGNPETYEVRAPSGAVVRPAQTSNYFSNLPSGTYNIVVKDACANNSVQSVTIEAGVYDIQVNENQKTGFNYLKTCDLIDHQIRVSYNGSYSLPADKFPIRVKYTVIGPGGSPVTVIEKTLTSNSSQYTPIDVPFYYGQEYTVKQELTDACGQTFEKTQTINRLMDFQVTQPTAACGQAFIGLIRINSVAAPITITFVDYPPGFNPSDYNSDFQQGTYTATLTTNPTTGNRRYDIGSPTNPIPPGAYKIRVSDSCGHSVEKTITVNTMQPLLRLFRQNPGCDDNETSVRILVTNHNNLQKAGDITSMKITAAPAGFPYALPYDVSNNIVNGEFYMGQLPVGDYTFTAGTSCGTLLGRYALVGKEKSSSYNVTYNCGSANLTASLTSRYAGVGLFLQRFNQETNTWEHPTTGISYTEGATITQVNAHRLAVTDLGSGGTSQVIGGTLNNIQTTGTFRLIAQYNVYTDGVASTSLCRDLLQTFEIPPGGLSLNNFYTIGCGNGKYSLVIDASGISPVTYEIISKDGNPISINNGTDPVFENLEPGLYTVRITDSCPNTIVTTIQIQGNKLPKIQAENICHGENGRLYISGLSFMRIRWFKNGVDTGVTGNSYNFAPYNNTTDIGLYEAHITYSNTSGSCANTIISFNLTPANENNPSAGTGQTVILTNQDITQPLNLFDYLTGPYDTHGYWADTENTGLLNDNIWNAQSAASGTYNFVYTVDGTCSGTATATVTIIIQGECYPDGVFDAGVSNPSKHGITSLARSAVGEAGNWPTVIENAHTVLESKSKGFVVNRLSTNEINAIAQPANGMMVYDTDLHCIRIYVENTLNPNASRWMCFNTPACPQ